MNFDLLTTPWLDARRASGRIERVSPADITSGSQDPFVDIVAPRPDLRAAGLEWLIGLLQTTMEPASEAQWRALYQTPPTRDALARAFEPASHAFDLRHPEHPFMQELGLSDAPDSAINLLFATPAGQTLRHNKDLFTKRRTAGALCTTCSALALFALQSMAQSGGRGHRTSLRGGGPLSTHVEGTTLWAAAWLNVLPRDAWLPDHPRSFDVRTFPWLAPASHEHERPPLTLGDVGVAHHYWGMPRRVLIEWSDDKASCSLCGSDAELVATGVRTRPNGFDYKGSWDHPLTPTYEKDADRLAVKGSRTGAGYRQWRGLVVNRSEDGRRPAPVVGHLWTRRAEGLRVDTGWRLSVQGMETEQATVTGWYEGEMTAIEIPGESERSAHEEHIEQLLAGAELARRYLYGALKEAAKPADPVPGDDAFWSATEPAFHKARLGRDRNAARIGWQEALVREAVGVFEALVPYADIADTNPAAIAHAQRGLERNLRSAKMRKALRIDEDVVQVNQ